MTETQPPILEARSVTKRFGSVTALSDVSVEVWGGSVTCLLGDNGAGKSTLISILSGVVRPDSGSVLVDGHEVVFGSPADALDLGIATVFQDLAVVPIAMPVYRNFFLGREPTRGRTMLRRLDVGLAKRITHAELHRIGIDLDSVSRPAATLSGGERQCLAIARAVYFGARVLILDEPTSALGVREAAVVLRYIREAAARGLGVILITHNVHHAHAAGDRFTVLARGSELGTFQKAQVSLDDLTLLMAGGEQDVLGLEAAVRADASG